MNTVATTHFFCNGQGRYVITVLAECWIIKGVNSYRCKGMLFFFSTCRGKKSLFYLSSLKLQSGSPLLNRC